MIDQPATLDELRALVRTLAFGVVLLCIAVMIDFNDLRRLDRRVDARLFTLEGRHGALVTTVDALRRRTPQPPPPDERAEHAPAPKRTVARSRPAAPGTES